MHRSLPRNGRLFRLLVLCDAAGGAIAYGVWRWAERNHLAALSTPAGRLWAAIALVVGGALLAALLVRWLVYQSSSWEPSFLVALAGVVTTPLIGAPLMRSVAVAELEHRTSASRYS